MRDKQVPVFYEEGSNELNNLFPVLMYVLTPYLRGCVGLDVSKMMALQAVYILYYQPR